MLQEVQDAGNGILKPRGTSATLPAGSRSAHAVVGLSGGVRFKIFEVFHSVEPHSDGAADRGAIDRQKTRLGENNGAAESVDGLVVSCHSHSLTDGIRTRDLTKLCDDSAAGKLLVLAAVS